MNHGHLSQKRRFTTGELACLHWLGTAPEETGCLASELNFAGQASHGTAVQAASVQAKSTTPIPHPATPNIES